MSSESISLQSSDIESEYRKRRIQSLLPALASLGLAAIFNWWWLASLLLTGPLSWMWFSSVRARAVILRQRYANIAKLHNWAMAQGPSSWQRQTWREHGEMAALNWFVYMDTDNGEWWRDLTAFANADESSIATLGAKAVNSAMFMNTWASSRGLYNPRMRQLW